MEVEPWDFLRISIAFWDILDLVSSSIQSGNTAGKYYKVFLRICQCWDQQVKGPFQVKLLEMILASKMMILAYDHQSTDSP